MDMHATHATPLRGSNTAACGVPKNNDTVRKPLGLRVFQECFTLLFPATLVHTIAALSIEP
jgi:hypothetical protein